MAKSHLKAPLFALLFTVFALPATGHGKEKPRPGGPDPDEPFVFRTETARTQSAETASLVCHFALGGVHNAAFGAALVAKGLVGEGFNFTAWSTNLGLKACPPDLTLPPDLEFEPPGGACTQDVLRPALSGRASNVLGAQLAVRPDGGDWGPSSRPSVFSWNTDVVVTTTFDTPPANLGGGLRRFPVGLHKEAYRAENHATFWDYLYVPGLPFPKGAERVFGKNGAKAAELAFNVAVEAGLIAADLTLDLFAFADTPTGTINQQVREIAVLDVVPPRANVTRDTFTVEALELGGASILGITPEGQANGDLLRSGFTVTDNCDPEVELVGPNPPFWPIGETTRVRWTARDDGPNRQHVPNTTTIDQFVTVVDTLPPTVLAAPAKVVETQGDSATVVLEPPRVFDFGDADPTIELEGQAPPETLELPLGQNLLEWRATDDFGNTDADFQLINVKAAGTNRPPTARARGADALTFAPQEIILRGADPDDDPLDFRIEQFPPDGGFEAPLLPYFIEDFRGDFEARSTCDPNRPWGELANPDHVLITDEGLSYVVDCHANRSRIVVLDAERNVLAGREMERNSSLNNGLYFVPGQDILLYVGQDGPAGARFYLLDPVTLDTIRKYRAENVPSIYSGTFAFLVNEYNIMFLPDGLGNVRVLDLDEAEEAPATGEWILPEPFAQFEIDPGETAGGGFTVARDMVLTPDNEILVVAEGRVHKMSPTTRDATGAPVLGEMIGWIGACASGEGCDPERRASRGFSCITGVTCQTGDALYFGDGPGQFSQSFSASVDRRGTFYVADWGNSRVQRFTDDGVFGGEAVSVCPPEKRCFLLGDFGRPDAVAVNSRNLYVFDKDTDVIHVFETSVIEPIDDTSARVVYTANDGFQGTDAFTFSTSDGLDRSAAATVTIDVSRQFRAPLADRLRFTGREDEPLALRLSGQDPDGALDLPLDYQVLTPPSVGRLTGAPPNLTFRGPEHWYGKTEFTFRVSDGRDWSEPETVTLVVEPVNDAPVLEFVSVDTDDPATFAPDVTAGYPVTFQFRYTDVDDVDLHRFDVDWTARGGGDTQSDVVAPTEDNASPLMVSMPNTGEIVATWTYTEDFSTETVRACLSDNVVLSGEEKFDSTTTLQDCVEVDLVNLPRPELDVEVVSPRVVPGQYRGAIIRGRVTNRAPEAALTGTDGEEVELELRIDGQVFRDFAARLAPGESLEIAGAVNLPGMATGDSVTVEVSARGANGDVTAPSRTVREMVMGPPADIVVTASEGNESACALECARDAASCPPATEQPLCTLSDALDLAASQPRNESAPVIVLGPGTLLLDEAVTPLPVRGSLDLVGLGADRSTLSGTGRYPFFSVGSGVVRMRDLSLDAGTTDGIIKNQVGVVENGVIEVGAGARLSLERVSLTGHVGEALLRSHGELALDGVTLEGNRMERSLVESLDGGVEARNLTLLDNDLADSEVGGLIVNRGGAVVLSHLTASGNNTPVLRAGDGAGFTSLADSVLDGDGRPACHLDGGADLVLEGANAFSPDAGCGAGDIVLAPGHLAPARDAGGLTVRLPSPDGPLVDAARGACPATDTLGGTRPLDGNGDGEPACDLGAVERLPGELLSSVIFDGRAAGDGFYLVADGVNLSAAYFGYDSRGEVMWLLGSAPLTELQPALGGAFTLDLLESGRRGAFFAPQDPGADPLEPWGKVTLRYDDCDGGQAVLDGVHGSKVMALDPLVARGSCRGPDADGNGGPAPRLAEPNLSGVFFDARASGDGFYLVDDGRNVSLAYFGYTASGEPQWLIGSEARANLDPALGRQLVFALQRAGDRGAFDAPQDPGADPLDDWGTLRITFDGCRAARAVLTGGDGEKSMNLSALVATEECGL